MNKHIYYRECSRCKKQKFISKSPKCHRCASDDLIQPIYERFLKYIKKSDSCWLWKGFIDKDGYGSFKYKNLVRAHRVSWLLHKGTIPKGKWVLHNCPTGDNPSCVNPDHLFVGTAEENNKDAAKKGRTARGEKNRNAKLTEKQVLEIRDSYIPYRMSGLTLAKKFGIKKNSIYPILKRKSWKHI